MDPATRSALRVATFAAVLLGCVLIGQTARHAFAAAEAMDARAPVADQLTLMRGAVR